MKKKIYFFLFFGLANLVLFGQGTESFDNLNAPGNTYVSGSFIGNGNIEWVYNGVRKVTNLDYAITSPSCGFGTSDARNVYANVQNGVGSLSYQVRSYYTGGTAAERTINVYVANNLVDEFTLPEMGIVYERTIEAIDNLGTTEIRFESVATRQIVLDEIVWTGYTTSGNIPPYILRIYQYPLLYVDSETEVKLTAEIYDADGSVTSAWVSWGYSYGNYPNSLPMINDSGNLYSTNGMIPNHSVGTTIYYVIFAEDEDNEQTNSAAQNYRVGDYTETSYYSPVENLSGNELWAGLRTIISGGHTSLTETEAKAIMYYQLDNLNGLVQCIYTGDWAAPINPPDYTPEGFSYEHAYPQSWYNESGDNIPEQIWANSDLHHLFPARGDANSSRNNNPFDYATEVGTVWGSGEHFSYRGSNAFTISCFEPADKFKGDLARAIFYFSVRYYDNGIGLIRFDVNMLPTLYQWHMQDTVDSQEKIRNTNIYGAQNNRNPFIDHPEYVEEIWGNFLHFSPQNLSATNIGATTFTANWVGSSGSIEYRLDVSKDSDFLIYEDFVPFFKNRPVTETSVPIVGLTTGETYYFRVKAYDITNEMLSLNSVIQEVFLEGNIVYYWNFNENVPESEMNWQQPILSQYGNGDLIYTFSKAYSYLGTTINGMGTEENGGSFSPQGDLGSINNGEYLQLNIPTTNHENIIIMYPTRRTSTGFTSHEILYTLDGFNWISKEIVDISAFDNDWLAPQMVIIDFTNITEVNQNSHFAVRIVLDGASHSAGNNRIDNLQVLGNAASQSLEQPQNVQLSIVGNSVTITWDSVQGATSYRVEESDSPNGTFITAQGILTGTQWTGEAISQTKFYRVIALKH
jgi:endonuclease I